MMSIKLSLLDNDITYFSFLYVSQKLVCLKTLDTYFISLGLIEAPQRLKHLESKIVLEKASQDGQIG